MTDTIEFDIDLVQRGAVKMVQISTAGLEDGTYHVTLTLVEPELKPCPFCGDRAELHEPYLVNQGWNVRCINCLNTTAEHGGAMGARAAWNRRAE